MTTRRLEEPKASQLASVYEIEPLYGGLAFLPWSGRWSLWPVQRIADSRALCGEREETWVPGLAPQSLIVGSNESFSCRASAFPSVWLDSVPIFGWVYLLLCLALCPLLSRAGNRQEPLRGMWAVKEGGPGFAGAQQVWGDF